MEVIREVSKREINVFCSVSGSSLDDVKGLLLPSLERQTGDYSIKLHLVDYSGFNRVRKINSKIVEVVIHNNYKQLGFGAAHNFLFSKVKPDNFFLIINADISCNKMLLKNLLEVSERDEKVGIVEARQLPYEHPKGYDDKTMETNWASGACILVNPKFFEEAGGFDEAFWMYCEDVDLSWRAWLSGYRIIYCPEAVAYHYTGGYFEYREDRYYHEHLWGGVNYLYLAYKYWGEIGLASAKIRLHRQIMPKILKIAILREFSGRKPTYQRAAKFSKPLSSLKNRIGIIGYNRYK